MSNHNDDMCFKNDLNLCKLCCSKAKVTCLSSEDIKSKKLCSESIKANHLMVEQEVANTICVSDTLTASKVKALSINSNDLCAQSGVINNLCVNNLTAGSINYCEKYRAVTTFNSNLTYTLGSPINWNSIIDDPNGNVALAPFSYTIPVSGYYIVSVAFNTFNLQGSATLGGIPIGVLTVLSNGNLLRQASQVYLTFSSKSSELLSALIYINAGDVITSKYEIFYMDPVAGLIPYVGTVDVVASGPIPFTSGFSIHYLSSSNCSSPIICQPCPVVEVPCTPVTVNCYHRSSLVDDPCDSCQ